MSALQQTLNTAFAKHGAGDIDGAMQLYRAVLTEEPQHPDALHMLGVIAHQLGNAELALKLIEAALEMKPAMPFAWHNRSLVLRVLGRPQEALQASAQAVALDPGYAEAWSMMGILSRELRDYERAGACHARATALRPNDPNLRSEQALSLYAAGDLQGAYKIMRDTLKKDNNIVPLTLANVLKSAGYPEHAIPYFRNTRGLLPQNGDVRVNEAMAHLQIGDFAQGWELWETRPNFNAHFRHIRLWRREKTGHLLLYEDQGIGDAIHCIRYVPLLRDCAGRVTLQVAPALQKLLAANFPDIHVMTTDEPAPDADARARLLSLPAWHGTKIDNIPDRVPYLHAEDEWRAPWREKLAGLPTPRVGIVWGGNAGNHNDHLRSIPFAQLDPILDAGSAHIVSLQKGAQKAQTDLATVRIFDADPLLDDFAATAGLLAKLILLITVDTAAAHLAGAMGKPVWLLIPFDPDWRWLLGREDSPWYPHMRIFRQTAPRDWTPVIAKAAEELRKFLTGDASVLQPAPWTGAPLRQSPHAITLPDI